MKINHNTLKNRKSVKIKPDNSIRKKSYKMSKKGGSIAASLVKLWVPAGQATPTPPIGPALGQRGVKAIDFCKQYNDRTKEYLPGTPMRCHISIRPDRTFAFDIKPPTTAFFLKKAAGVEKASGEPGKVVAGTVSLKHIYEIAKIKHKHDSQMQDLSLKQVCWLVKGSCRSMGIQVVP